MSDIVKALLMCAASCQGGHSGAGYAAAEALGIPFPLTMENLRGAAVARGYDPDELWPWWKRMRERRAAFAQAEKADG